MMNISTNPRDRENYVAAVAQTLGLTMPVSDDIHYRIEWLYSNRYASWRAVEYLREALQLPSSRTNV